MNTREIENAHEVDVYPRRDIVIVRGKGCYLYDEDDNEYLDCASNIGVSSIGHGNEEVAKALYAQYLRLGSCYSMFYNDVRAELAQKLTDIVPGHLNRVFLCNSGSEAVEAGIKFARASTGKTEIIAAMRGFHGKTMGALGATWGPNYQKPFLPMIEGFKHAPFNNYEKLEAKVTDDTAAILLEPIQGEGGVNVGNEEYFQKVRELCDERGILLIMDEVQTGFGRTGRWFASEHYVSPDILCLAKSIAGGVPMGATVCNSKIEVPSRSHTSTFGGNPLACAAAIASMDYIERKDLVKNSEDMGDYLMERLNALNSPKIREVRGKGLMVGIELKEKAGPYMAQLMEKGIIALLAGNTVIRLLPPLIIKREEIDRVVKALEEILC